MTIGTSRQARVVYAAGLAQGIALVTFPAASTIFTDPNQYHLSASQSVSPRSWPRSPAGCRS